MQEAIEETINKSSLDVVNDVKEQLKESMPEVAKDVKIQKEVK